MRRDQLAALGIQLPVLPTIVMGGLPGEPDWAPRLERIGLDVVSSGAASDTAETFAAAAAAVPHRPVKATGTVTGARIIESEGPERTGSYRLHPDEILVIDAPAAVDDANDVARLVLDAIGDDPSSWWVAARDLMGVDDATAERRLVALVDGVRHVRLYLAKQQFDA